MTNGTANNTAPRPQGQIIQQGSTKILCLADVRGMFDIE